MCPMISRKEADTLLGKDEEWITLLIETGKLPVHDIDSNLVNIHDVRKLKGKSLVDIVFEDESWSLLLATNDKCTPKCDLLNYEHHLTS